MSITDRQLLEKVDSRIDPNDGMYKGDADHYFRVGLSATACIATALSFANRDADPEYILDMPSGHGRVLRFLLHRFPNAKFTVCDLDSDAVDVCIENFNVRGVYSKTDLITLELKQQFDLIWCGSLITHLDENKILPLFQFFERHLAPAGLLVFTTAGDRVREWMLNGQFDYGINRSDIPNLIAGYDQSGYAYTDYPYLHDYGISLTAPSWIRDRVGRGTNLREVYFAPHGWDEHQDVYGYVKP